jgi:hypothetical protein
MTELIAREQERMLRREEKASEEARFFERPDTDGREGA